MRPTPRFSPNRVSIKLLLFIVLFNVVYIIVLSGIQLYFDYQKRLELIEEKLFLIEKSYLPTVVGSLFVLDMQQLERQLVGIKEIPFIEQVRIKDRNPEKGFILSIGNNNIPKGITREYPLVYHHTQGIDIPLGTLVVTADMAIFYTNMKEYIRKNLINDVVILFLLSLSFFFITRRLITRHLKTMVDYTTTLSLDSLDAELRLNRKPPRPGKDDELDLLVKSMNDMRTRLIKDNNRRKIAEEELRKHHDHLEELVEKRTVELAVAKKDAEEANAAKGDFLARMSHDIRTPLNAVTGLTNIVLKSELTTEQQDYLNKVRNAGASLLTVINDILDFSKVEAGQLELSHAPFDLDLIMEQLADLFSEQVAQKDLELIFTVAPPVPRLLVGDAGRLTQVLTNLVANSVKFSDTGEIVVMVDLDNHDNQSHGQTILKFQISDSGVGIDADALATIFDAFTQADSYLTRKHTGTGLGLAICRWLVELMGGRIWAESTPEQGSTFSFTTVVEIQEKEKKLLSLSSDMRGLKTLVVDDSATASLVTCELLESFSFNVTAVDSGEQAIETLRHASADQPYQLVLLDWKMPGMDGIETAEVIRTTLNLSRPPIIILVTAFGRELVQKRLNTRAVVDSLLLKPIKPSELLNTIMELIEPDEAAVMHRTQEPTTQLAQRLAGKRVLVVEDSALNRDVTLALLEEVGVVVEVAENGRIAVDKLTALPNTYYDAVLMDIQMPVMDGYEATGRIRDWEDDSQGTDHRIPIIALTAHALKGEKEKCLAARLDDYISKPLDEEELHRVLLKWMVSPRQTDNSQDF